MHCEAVYNADNTLTITFNGGQVVKNTLYIMDCVVYVQIWYSYVSCCPVVISSDVDI